MGIAVLATPVISRLFDPDDFGVAAIFVATTAVAASMMALAYERAVLYPREESTAGQIFAVALIISAASALAMYLVIGFAFLIWPEIVSDTRIGGFIWLFPVGALLMSLRATFVALSMRREDFSSIAVADVFEALSVALSRILWGLLLASSVAGLLLGHFLGLVIAVLICGGQSLSWFRKTIRPLSISEFRKIAGAYKDYPIFRAPAKIAFTASSRLPVIAFGFLFPVEIVGYYAMAHRAAAKPLDAASISIRNVLLRKIMGLRQLGKPMAATLLKVVIALVVTGIPIFSVMFFFGGEVLGWFLGPKWVEAGRFVEILAPYLFILWVGSFTPAVLESLRLNKLRLNINTGNFLVRLATFAGCGLTGQTVSATLWWFVAVSCTYQLFVFVIAAKAALTHDQLLASADPAAVGLPG